MTVRGSSPTHVPTPTPIPIATRTQPPLADTLSEATTPFHRGRAGAPYYLESVRYTLTNNNYSTGVRGGQRKQGVCVVGAASVDTQWEVAVLEPTEVAQLESEGKPVLANAFFALKHCSTQV